MTPQTLEQRAETNPTAPVERVEPTPRPTRPRPFSAEEEAAMHAEDRGAAAAIAGIMVAILTAGLLLYTVIALIVRAWPM